MAKRIDESDLPAAWTQPRTTARLHLLAAKEKPIAVILRRKPSKCYHVIKWNTQTDDLVHGSWFRGRVYEARCDLSWDGRWMVYMAMGDNGETWNGICKPPWLKTYADVPNYGTWAGGGVFIEKDKLLANDAVFQEKSLANLPPHSHFSFKVEHLASGGETFPIIEYRLARDGWTREGKHPKEREFRLKHSTYATYCKNDPGWSWRPTRKHPALRMYYRGYMTGGYTFEFELEGSDLLDVETDWATWTSKGDLITARHGGVARYTLDDLKRGKPSFEADLEPLERPADHS